MAAVVELLSGLLPSKERENSVDDDSTECYGLVPYGKRKVGSRRSMVRKIGGRFASKRKRNFRNRSLVRVIGSALPLKPCERAYFQIFHESQKRWTSQAKTFLEDNIDGIKARVPTLADIGGLWNEDTSNGIDSINNGTIKIKTVSSGISGLDLIKCEYDNDCSWASYKSEDEEENLTCCSRIDSEPSSSNDVKISVLEQELAQLRQQIALIVTSKDETKSESVNQPAAIPMAPPPPPPMTIAHSSPKVATPDQGLQAVKQEKPPMKETFSDILKGIHNVKLRSVNSKRSPGGTPLRKKQMPSNQSTNAVDIITIALQKKFARSMKFDASPDKENAVSPTSDFGSSPEKMTKRRRSSRTARRSSTSFAQPSSPLVQVRESLR